MSAELPRNIGEFEIVAKLGPSVYRARQPSLGREVALKVVPVAALIEDARKRFVASVAAASKLDHPHIVRVYSLSTAGGLYAVAMSYIAGDSLAGTGPREPHAAAELVRKVATALTHARTRGVPHPGLTPDAVLLDRDGEPRLIGFTPSQSAEPAPESADVQALGTILDTCLGPNARTAGALGAIGNKCRKSGYADGAAVIADLDRFLGAGRPRRATARAALAAITVVLLVGAAVGAWLLFGPGRGESVSTEHGAASHPEPSKPAARAGLPPLTDAAGLRRGTPEAERAVGEWVLDCGGHVYFRRGNTNLLIRGRPAPELDGTVPILGVSLNDRPVRDEDLANLALLGQLTELHLDGTEVTDDGVVRHLSGMASLKRLSMERTGLTDAAVPYLGHLSHLYVRKTQVTPNGVTLLRRANRAIDVLHDVEAPSPGAANGALWFEGGASLEVPLRYQFGQPLTIEATIRPEPQLMAHTSIFAARSTDGRAVMGLHLAHVQAGTVFGMQLQVTGAKWHGTSTSRRPVRPHPLGRTSRVAGVFDGQNLLHFRDGKLEGSVALTIPAPKGEALTALIGRHPNPGAKEFYLGTIDEVRISSIARYERDYEPAARLEADQHTIALYHFDEGDGDVAKDSSGRQNHGRIHSARWVRVD